MDIFAKCRQSGNMERVLEAHEIGLYPYFLPLDGTEGTEVAVNGRNIIMIGSNNYLGLTAHPKVREADQTCCRSIRDQLHRLPFFERNIKIAPGTRSASGRLRRQKKHLSFSAPVCKPIWALFQHLFALKMWSSLTKSVTPASLMAAAWDWAKCAVFGTTI